MVRDGRHIRRESVVARFMEVLKQLGQDL